jgi:hypothetical protein
MNLTKSSDEVHRQNTECCLCLSGLLTGGGIAVVLFFGLLRQSCYEAQAALEPLILLPQPPSLVLGL